MIRQKNTGVLGVLLMAVLVLTLGTGVGYADTQVDERVGAPPDAVVEIENVSGSVRVTGSARGEVHVTGTLGKLVEGVEVEVSDGKIEIEVKLPEDTEGSEGELEAHLEVAVPPGSSVEVSTVSAQIDVTDVGGRVSADSVSGAIGITGSPAAVSVDSVSSEVAFSGTTEHFEVDSVSGSIVADGVGESFSLETVNGSMTVTASGVREGEFETVSGMVKFQGDVVPGGELDVESLSGTVTLVLPASQGAEFDIETFSGKVVNELGPTPQQESEGPGKELEFTTGGGGASIDIETFSGAIEILASP